MVPDLEDDLCTVVEWGKNWLESFNASKPKLLSTNRFSTHFLPSVLMNDSQLTESTQIRLLGLTFTNTFSWKHKLSQLQNLLQWRLDLYFGCGTFFHPKVYFISIRLPFDLVLSIAAIFGLEPLLYVYIFLTEISQKRILNLVGPDLCTNLQPFSHCRNMASLSLFYNSVEIVLMIWKNKHLHSRLSQGL